MSYMSYYLLDKIRKLKLQKNDKKTFLKRVCRDIKIEKSTGTRLGWCLDLAKK